MDKALTMGSCRVVKTMMDATQIYSGGHLHTTTDVLQAYEIMKGNITIPPSLERYVFDGWGNKPNKLMDPECDILIIEISSTKNYRYNNLNLHIGYEDFIERKEVQPLENVITKHETEEEIKNNLNKIKDKYKCSKIVILPHNNIACLPNRYFLSYVLSSWCKDNNEIFFDPTSLISQHGISNTLALPVEWVITHNLYVTVEDKKYDPQHYTEFMIEKLKSRLLQIIETNYLSACNSSPV